MDPRPIPAFYCCYLLRSTVRHSSLYVGSTPNPIRRLAQHNGVTKGGAVKTSRDSLRPWEMACIVSGFPSHIAALQFEWAWQNTHLTRHIPGPQRITEAHSSVRISPKTGRTRRRPARPRICLTDKVSNLHLLLRVDSFARWPLEVRFFCEDVYRVWKRWSERVDGKIRDGVQIILDRERFEEKACAEDPDALPASNQAQAPKVDGILRGGIKAVDVTYAASKPHVERSQALLADTHQARCSVCQKALEKQSGLLTTCPRPECASISHMACLSSHLLDGEGQHDMVLPVEGSCPTCKSQIKWIDVVRELSLRAYGQKELTKLLKKPREKKVKVPKTKKAKKGLSSVDSDLEPDDDEQDNDDAAQTTEEEEMNMNTADFSLQGWSNRELEDGDDAMSVSSLTSLGSEDPVSQLSPSKVGFAARQRQEIVIEDSDWDDAEVLD